MIISFLYSLISDPPPKTLLDISVLGYEVNITGDGDDSVAPELESFSIINDGIFSHDIEADYFLNIFQIFSILLEI